MEWEILTTEEFGRWYNEDLTDEQAGAVDARVDMLSATGPALSRPVVGAIETSRHRNMKELRCSKNGQLRVLFAFDPLRRAILLIGGDKSEGAAWNEWYVTMVPVADDLFDRHLETVKEQTTEQKKAEEASKKPKTPRQRRGRGRR
jgi:hypothetical protein